MHALPSRIPSPLPSMRCCCTKHATTAQRSRTHTHTPADRQYGHYVDHENNIRIKDPVRRATQGGDLVHVANCLFMPQSVLQSVACLCLGTKSIVLCFVSAHCCEEARCASTERPLHLCQPLCPPLRHNTCLCWFRHPFVCVGHCAGTRAARLPVSAHLTAGKRGTTRVLAAASSVLRLCGAVDCSLQHQLVCSAQAVSLVVVLGEAPRGLPRGLELAWRRWCGPACASSSALGAVFPSAIVTTTPAPLSATCVHAGLVGWWIRATAPARRAVRGWLFSC